MLQKMGSTVGHFNALFIAREEVSVLAKRLTFHGRLRRQRVVFRGTVDGRSWLCVLSNTVIEQYFSFDLTAD